MALVDVRNKCGSAPAYQTPADNYEFSRLQRPTENGLLPLNRPEIWFKLWVPCETMADGRITTNIMATHYLLQYWARNSRYQSLQGQALVA